MNKILLLKAINFAAQKHSAQRRKDSDASPYVNHPVYVAFVLADIGGIDDPEILAAAVLHDTIEDTDTTREQLISAFGVRVCKLVEELTDDKSLPKKERKQLQLEHAHSLSPKAVLIKLGDKISNIEDITNTPPSGWSIERRREYVDWVESVIKNCPKANDALENHFYKVLKLAKQTLNTD